MAAVKTLEYPVGNWYSLFVGQDEESSGENDAILLRVLTALTALV